jgi:hypothetical protein
LYFGGKKVSQPKGTKPRRAVRKLDEEVADNRISEAAGDAQKRRLKKLSKQATEGDKAAREKLDKLAKRILRRDPD